MKNCENLDNDIKKMKNYKEMMDDIECKINNGKKIRLENPKIKDIEKLKEFDAIITPGVFFDIIIRKKFSIQNVLGFPTVMWHYADGIPGYEVGDTCMGFFPEVLTAQEAIEAVKEFKEE